MKSSNITVVCLCLLLLGQHTLLYAAQKPNKQKTSDIRKSLNRIYKAESTRLKVPIGKNLLRLREKANPAGDRPLIPINGKDTAAKIALVHKAELLLKKYGNRVQINKTSLKKAAKGFLKNKSQWETPPNWDIELAEELQSKHAAALIKIARSIFCLLYTSPSPRDATLSRMPSSA